MKAEMFYVFFFNKEAGKTLSHSTLCILHISTDLIHDILRHA